MNDKIALNRKISSLVAKDTYDGRALRLGRAGHPETITYLLQAIDDTMMLREAVFSVGSSAVVLRISGKRLQAVVSATPDLDPALTLFNMPLSADTSEALMKVAELLEKLTQLPGFLTLERRPAAATSQKFGSGVGVQALSADWGIDIDAEKPDPLTYFTSACASVAIAILEVNDGTQGPLEGDEEVTTAFQAYLLETWQATDAKYTAKFVEHDGPHLRVLDGVVYDNAALVCGIFGQKQCLALIPTEDIAQILTAWSIATS